MSVSHRMDEPSVEPEGEPRELAVREALPPEIIEKVLVGGDLAKLTSQERVSYYGRVCDSIGLNPLTRPFEYITLNSKLTLYAKRDATDQLRSLRKVSIEIVGREKVGDVYAVTARASTPDGRRDESIGAVTVGTLKGDALANALMKAETKAKRRVTLSIVGLGWLDETEIETIPGARVGEPNGKPLKLGLVAQDEAQYEAHDPAWDDADAPLPQMHQPEPDAPGDATEPALSKVKQSLYDELLEFSPKQRDALIRRYSQVVGDDGKPGPAVENLDRMLSPAISEKWASVTLGKIRAARQTKAASEGAA